MRRDVLTSILGIIVFTVLLGLVYPLVITGVSQVAFPGNANGQKVYVDGKLVGSKIIGQSFASPVIGKNGKPEEAEKVFATVKGKSVQIPDATVIAATDSSVQVAVSDDAVQSKTADFTFAMNGCVGFFPGAPEPDPMSITLWGPGKDL